MSCSRSAGHISSEFLFIHDYARLVLLSFFLRPPPPPPLPHLRIILVVVVVGLPSPPPPVQVARARSCLISDIRTYRIGTVAAAAARPPAAATVPRPYSSSVIIELSVRATTTTKISREYRERVNVCVRTRFQSPIQSRSRPGEDRVRSRSISQF